VSPPQPDILVIGQEPALIYLLKRYAEKGGYRIVHQVAAPATEALRELAPQAVVFTTLDDLEKAQSQMVDLVNWEMPILVCSSGTDVAQARELGADHCLLHPLSYEAFQAALSAIPEHNRPRQNSLPNLPATY
jgi:CheY-like chemotaxis protein